MDSMNGIKSSGYSPLPHICIPLFRKGIEICEKVSGGRAIQN
jgi:hypothetical protein